LTKADIAEIIYKIHGGLSKKEASDTVDDIFSYIKNNLKTGSDVRISGFGTFSVVHKEKRTGRNPRTGDKITIPSRKLVNFKPARVFKERLNK
jgi:nucleoid DNA-binding protein